MSFLDNITTRDIAAFKAGSWATVPADYAIRNYAWPYAKKNWSEKGFYNRINRFGRDPRRNRRLTADVVMKDMKKRHGNELWRASKRAKYKRKAFAAGSGDNKTAFSSIVLGNQSTGALNQVTLFDVDQGTSNGDRVGSKIHAKYVNVRGFVNSLNTTQPIFARLVIVQDNKPQLGGLTVNMFAPQTDANAPVNYDVSGDLTQITNPLNTSRFRILSDRRWKLGPKTANNEGTNILSVDYNVKVDRYIEYLTDAELVTANKIRPLFYAFIWCEMASGTVGAGMLNREIDFYQHFNG